MTALTTGHAAPCQKYPTSQLSEMPQKPQILVSRLRQRSEPMCEQCQTLQKQIVHYHSFCSSGSILLPRSA
jgi:hypothetical protein